MLSKSLIQFSVDGQGCVPSLLCGLSSNYDGGNEDDGTSFKRSSAHTAELSTPTLHQATADPSLRQRLLDTLRQVWVSLSCGDTAPFSWVLVHTRFCLCPPRVCFPVLWKFWRLYGGINSHLLQDGSCHSQVCCTQSPCPSGRPLLTCVSTGDTLTLKGRSDSVSVGSLGAHKGLSLPSVSGGCKV